MKFNERAMVLVDLETTHLNPTYGEVLQIGAVRVNQITLEIEALFQAKLQPVRIERADPKSLEVNGYTPENWKDAVDRFDAWKSFFAFARQSVFCSYANQFDWGFIKPIVAQLYMFHTDSDVRRFGPFARHLIDVPSVAWGILGTRPSMSKNQIASELGLDTEGYPHDALKGALHGLEVLRALRRWGRKIVYEQAA